jgi:hypothetical protein
MKKISILMLLAGVITVGCSSSGSNGAGSTEAVESTAFKKEALHLSASSMVPIVDNKATKAELILDSSVQAKLKLLSVKVKGDHLSSEQVDVSSCGSLAQNGRCTISVQLPTKSGNALISLEFQDENGRKFSAATILSYEETNASRNGIYYHVTNNSTVIEENGKSSYIIPMVLAEDFSELKVSSTSPLSSASLICDANSFKKDVRCDVVVNNVGKNYENSIKIDGVSAKTHAKSSISIPYTVAVGDKGKIMVGTANVFIPVANGDSSNIKEVLLLNDGTADSTINSIDSEDKKIILDPKLCLNRNLMPSEDCSVKVNAKSELNGQGVVRIKYDATEQAKFNVIYNGVENVGLLLEEASANALKKTNVGSTAVTTINVKNNGTNKLSKIAFANLEAQNPDMQYIPADNKPCNTAGLQSLEQNEQCNVAIQYSPKAVQADSSIKFNAVASYQNSHNTTVTYSSGTVNIDYSANSYTADFAMPDSISNQITANGSDTRDITMTLTNSGDGKAKIETSTVPNGKELPAGMSLISNDCQVGKILEASGSAGNSCNVVYKLGPTTSAINSADNKWTSQLSFSYKPSGSASVSKNVDAAIAVKILPSDNAAISVSNVVAQASIPTGRVGSELDYLKLITNKTSIEYVYQNTGNKPAKNFVIDPVIAPGFKVDSTATTCAYGVTPAVTGYSDLAAKTGNTSCKFVLTEDKEILDSIYADKGQALIKQSGYKYINETKPVMFDENDNNSLTVNIIPAVAQNTIVNGTSSHSFDVIYNVIAGHKAAFPVEFTQHLIDGFNTAGNTSCSITGAGGKCSLAFNVEKYMPAYDYVLPYDLSLKDGTRYIRNYSVNYTLSGVYYNLAKASNAFQVVTVTNGASSAQTINKIDVNNLTIVNKDAAATVFGSSKQCVVANPGHEQVTQLNSGESCKVVVTPSLESTVTSLEITAGGHKQKYNFIVGSYPVLGGLFSSVQETTNFDDIVTPSKFSYSVASLNSLNASILGTSGSDNDKYSIDAVEADSLGNIYVTGGLESITSTAHGSTSKISGQSVILKLVDSQWQKVVATTAPIYGIALGNNGELYAGGNFSRAVNRDGSSLSSTSGTKLLGLYDQTSGTWTKIAEADGDIRAIRFNADKTKLYVAGNFRTIGGLAAASGMIVAEYDLGSHSWKQLAVANQQINTLEVFEGNIYVGGKFTRIAGQNIDYLAKYNLVNGNWAAAAIVNDEVRTISSSGAKLYVAGKFTSFNAGTEIDFGGNKFVAEYSKGNWGSPYAISGFGGADVITSIKVMLSFI